MGGEQPLLSAFQSCSDNRMQEMLELLPVTAVAVTLSEDMALYESDDMQPRRGQIRLLTISQSPSPSNDTLIQCSLHVVDLQSSGEYFALSYTWGAPTEHRPLSTLSDRPQCPILCNGTVLNVTGNLRCFLLRARQMPGLVDKKLWIDAICINQQDKRERSDQVRLMASIYSTAAVVVSWLGEQDQHTEPGFALLKKLKAASDHSPHLLDRLSKLSPDSQDHGDDEDMAAFSCRQSWVSVAHVFQRTYFNRAWIIQEVVLAKTVRVLCGGHELDWSAIAEASHFFSISGWARHLNAFFIESADLPSQQLGPQEHARLKFCYQSLTKLRLTAKECTRRKQQGYHLENRGAWARTLVCTLIRARSFKATDPRDKVYALLGLVYEYAKDNPGLIPAYELADQQQPAAAGAFTRPAIQILSDGDGDLLLLSCVEGEKHQQSATTGRLPSWVPDWSCEQPTGLRVTGYERYSASGDGELRKQPRPLPAIDEKALTLRLMGLRLDRVTMVGETKQAVLRGEPFPGWLEIVESLETLYRHGCCHAAAEHKVDVFWRTLIGNTAGYPPRLLSVRDGDRSRTLGASFAKWFREITPSVGVDDGPLGHRRPVRDGSNSPWHALVTRFRNLLDDSDGRWNDPQSGDAVSSSAYATPFSMSQHLRLFRTDQGYLVIGSECVEVGDSVWIVPGSRVPLLLRRAQVDRLGAIQPGPCTIWHRLVGGAYLHGVMQGEAVSPSATGMTMKEIQGLMEEFTLE